MSESLLTLTEKVYGKSKSKKKADNKKKKWEWL
jgi:hypothetical protein